MRIALDGLPLSRELTGIGHYTLELGLHLALECPDDHLSVVSPRPCVPVVEATSFPTNLKLLRPTLNPVVRYWWKRGLLKYLSRERVEIFHGTNYELPAQAGCATVLTIHDLSTVRHPETHEKKNVERAQANLPSAAHAASMIICPTEAVRQEIKETLAVPDDKVVAIHEAARTCFTSASPEEISRVKQKFSLSDQFLLYVGTIEPRKNLLSLVLAFEQTSKMFPNLQLVFAGRKGWKVDDLLAYIKRSRVGNKIVFTGYLSDGELSSLYSSCTLFIYPSIYEGFGLPPLEAMACGAPVIASDIASIAEVAGGAALLVKPDDFEQLKKAIEDLLSDQVARERLTKAGRKRAAQFSWSKTAREVRAVYDEALARHRANKKG